MANSSGMEVLEEFKSINELEDESGSKFMRKAKDNPIVPLGMAAGIAAVAYSIYNYRNRKYATSVYVIHTRVVAQGLVVGALTMGALYQMYQDFVVKKRPENKN